MTIIDSGATGHYFSSLTPLPKRKPTTTPITVTVANQETMTSTHTAELPLPALPPEARKVHIFPSLGTNLVGVTPLTQAGCTVTFTGTQCTIKCPGSEAIKCHATPQGLWALQIQELSTHTQEMACPTIGNSCTPGDIVAFHHAALFSPALSTLTTALLKGFIPPLPGLTVALLRKYSPNLEATAMGHMDNIKKNVRSTKKVRFQATQEDETGVFPPPQADNTRSNMCFLASTEPKHIVYSDQTGRLPHPSNTGNNYIMLVYDHDSNAILLRAYKNKTAPVLTATMKEIYTVLSKGGCKPQFHRLDNECPKELQDFLEQSGTSYQLTPPNDHRTNAAERAIRTAKNHLQAGWHSTDEQFPLYLWDRTLEQAELTLNLLRGSRINPCLSAWEQIHGRYDFNKSPIAPPGIKVLAHEKTTQRATWSTHAFSAWYIGPALKHYRCYKVWATKTRQERIVNQLMWFPSRPFPKLTSEDLLRATIEDLKTLLLHPPTETYIGNMEQTQRGELIQLSDILHQHHTVTVDNKKAPTTKMSGHPAPPLGVVAPQPPRRSSRTVTEPNRYTPHFGATAINVDTGKHAEYKELAHSSTGTRWRLGMAKEMGRLFQGFQSATPEHSVQGTNTCIFIKPSEVPAGKRATYIRIVAELREHKADPYRVRCTVGGNLIDFPGDKSTKVAELVTVKCLLNNIISTPNARAACIDLKDFYLNNVLPSPEYVFFKAELIPEEFMSQYTSKLHITPEGYVYAQVQKGMYGLPQAGKVASDVLLPRLSTAGYIPTGRIAGLFKHKSNSVYFALVVDDFLVQYTDPDDFAHLAKTLSTYYGITTDIGATKFCGITLQWDYTQGHVTLSMPGYIEKALQRFTHPTPKRPQHSPHKWLPPQYGATIQSAIPEDNTLPLDAQGIKRLQEVIGTLLFSARAVDNTMLVSLGTLAAAQTRGTEHTMQALVHLLDYAATHPDAAIRFHRSDMILFVHSDASYLSEAKARSRVGGYFYLGNNQEPIENPTPNGPIHVESRILKHIMAAASEAEIAALFHTGQEAVHFRQVLLELDRPQHGPTQITTDNSTADGFANKRTKIKRSKAMDMRFYWVQDRVEQGQIAVRWASGSTNHGDYFTKHHPPSHHTQVRPTYLYTGCCVCTDCTATDI
jgi:hypothetical protein